MARRRLTLDYGCPRGASVYYDALGRKQCRCPADLMPIRDQYGRLKECREAKPKPYPEHEPAPTCPPGSYTQYDQYKQVVCTCKAPLVPIRDQYGRLKECRKPKRRRTRLRFAAGAAPSSCPPGAYPQYDQLGRAKCTCPPDLIAVRDQYGRLKECRRPKRRRSRLKLAAG